MRDALGRCSRVLKQFVSRRRESRERFMVLAQTSNKVGATCLKLRLCLLVSSTFGSSRTCPQILTMILTLTTHTIEVPPVVYHIPVQLERRAARVKQTHRSACLYGLPTLDALSRSISTYTTRTCSASPHTVRRAIVVQPTVTPDAPSQRRCSTPPPHSYCSRPLPGTPSPDAPHRRSSRERTGSDGGVAAVAFTFDFQAYLGGGRVGRLPLCLWHRQWV